MLFLLQGEFVSNSEHENKSDSISNESNGREKLTDRLIDQGLLTKNMIDELRREWEDKKKETDRKKRRSKDQKD
jgi:hypothetical protein